MGGLESSVGGGIYTTVPPLRHGLKVNCPNDLQGPALEDDVREVSGKDLRSVVQTTCKDPRSKLLEDETTDVIKIPTVIRVNLGVY